MKRVTLSTILMILMVSASASIIRVALDNTQDYTNIQAAINASADGDTVLVYPGRYYENVSLNGKNITLASLELTTGDPTYIRSTTIDGCRQYSVIEIANSESSVKIQGLSITNGRGMLDNTGTRYGGGLLIYNLPSINHIEVVNCQIFDNDADTGGGVSFTQANVLLSGVTIKNNHATSGGGVFYYGGVNSNHSITFDPVNRSNIYNNYAASGSDIRYYLVNQATIIVDTFTVMNPWNFYANGIAYNSTITNPFTFDIQHSVHEEINHDLYVAPWGNDSNSGLSAAEPLKTIFLAVYKIASDSLSPKTIHLADGTYSRSLNDQLFPVSLKDHCRMSGQSRENTIMDCGGKPFCYLPFSGKNQEISSLFIVNSQTAVICLRMDNVIIKAISISSPSVSYEALNTMLLLSDSKDIQINDIAISSANSTRIAAIYASPFKDKLSLKDIVIKDVYGETSTSIIHVNGYGDIDASNIIATNNTSASTDEYAFNSLMQISPSQSGQRLRVNISNCSFTNNHQGRYQHMGHVRALNDTVFITNCTFADNTGGSSVLAVSGTSKLSNNIFWNPALPSEVIVPNLDSENYSNATFQYNNIRNGINGILNPNPQNIVNWGEGNLDLDPLFSNSGNHPYTLSGDSPLIDVGMDGAAAPVYGEYDAGGNERIWDGDGDGSARIDIGAYEYQTLYAPYNLTAEVSANNVFLEWEMPADPEDLLYDDRALAGYRIYRNGSLHTELNDPQQLSYLDRIAESDTLSYNVKALYGNVESPASNEVSVYVEVVGNEDGYLDSPPEYFLISPNPFKDIAIIRLGLQKQTDIKLEVYNLKGQLVRIINSGSLGKGEHSFWWNGDDESGKVVSSGIYFLRLHQDGSLGSVKKVTYLK